MPDDASMTVTTSVLVTTIGCKLCNGTNRRSPGNGSICIDSGVTAIMNGVLVMLYCTSITIPFGSDCIVSGSQFRLITEP